MKYLGIGLIVLGALAALVAGVLAVGAWQYHRGMAISTPSGIDETGYVRVGGIDQCFKVVVCHHPLGGVHPDSCDRGRTKRSQGCHVMLRSPAPSERRTLLERG